jgi:aspartyl-tRNA(Asn)/glutamyl-tRNA(Gln) amidotransferase subunit A
MQDARADWIARVEARLEGFDAVLCPTVPLLAPEIAPLQASTRPFRGQPVVAAQYFCFQLPRWLRLQPALPGPGELPVGLMLASVRGDARLAAVALAVEAALA